MQARLKSKEDISIQIVDSMIINLPNALKNKYHGGGSSTNMV
ncbi:hypothetical protein J2Z42_001745 [Clostridium algifaecis]|uniref:Uncharacterized protein n=1 Tax=Clostridium algifaecis TaxID=1472040 RepID=A0ABS4KSP5_9CLOT|nr:hypothetical protein [Clostridium algifaecis]